MAILNLCQVLVLQKCFWEEWREVPIRSTWRVLPWHGCGSDYLQGTAEEIEMVMCD
jgi:hypothetical protein